MFKDSISLIAEVIIDRKTFLSDDHVAPLLVELEYCGMRIGTELVLEFITMLLPLPANASSRTRLRMRLIDPILFEDSTMFYSAVCSLSILARFMPKSILALEGEREG